VRSVERGPRRAALAFAVIALLCAAGRTARAQDPLDTTRKITPAPPVTPPTGMPGTPALRLRLGRDTLPLILPSVLSRGDRESFRQAQAQIEAARGSASRAQQRNRGERERSAAWSALDRTRGTRCLRVAYP